MGHIHDQSSERGGDRDHWWWPFGGSDGAVASPLAVKSDQFLVAKSCTVSRISLDAIPHRVRFRRNKHTLMIFDNGCFVEGRRRIDGNVLGTSGPLDLGVDVVPACVDFEATAGPGSTVRSALISIDENFVEEGETFPATRLRPAVNLSGELLQPLVARLRQLAWRGGFFSDNLYLETLCIFLFREVLMAQGQGTPDSPKRFAGGLSGSAQRIIRDYLHENLDQKVSLDSLANQVGVSRFHFARAFKVSFGVSPYKYLLELRIRKAASLLCCTRDSIVDVALKVGFSSSGEFSRAFKEAMFSTPRDFRRGRL